MKSTLAVFGLGVALALASTNAFAHAHLKRASPAANASLEKSPEEVRLLFSEPLNAVSRVEVMTKAGKTMATGHVDPGSKAKNELMIPVRVQLPRGEYEVRWRAIAKDSHVKKGSYTFRIQ